MNRQAAVGMYVHMVFKTPICHLHAHTAIMAVNYLPSSAYTIQTNPASKVEHIVSITQTSRVSDSTGKKKEN